MKFCINSCKFCNIIWNSSRNYTQFADQPKRRLISQLIKGILRVLQKLLRHFNATIISTSCAVIVCLTCSFFFTIKWISDTSHIKPNNNTIIIYNWLSLQYCHEVPHVFKLSLYSIKSYIDNYTLTSSALSICALFILLM